MATIVRGAVPATEFALHHSLESLPDLEVECERIVRSGDRAVMPLLWVRYAGRCRSIPSRRPDSAGPSRCAVWLA